jgi:hypothetical protein
MLHAPAYQLLALNPTLRSKLLRTAEGRIVPEPQPAGALRAPAEAAPPTAADTDDEIMMRACN